MNSWRCFSIMNLTKSLDEAKSQCQNELYLNYEGLADLPAELFDEYFTGNLQRLYLKINNFTRITSRISEFIGLRVLSLNSNQLHELPESIGTLHGLECLDVGCNAVTELPSTIGNLHSLKSLQASSNLLSFLPPEIGKLQNLTSLTVAVNQITELCVELTNCSKLSTLNADTNRLRCLPRQLCLMKKIQNLQFSGNKLTCLPQDIGFIKSLENIFVDGNPHLTALPLSLLYADGDVGNERSGISPHVCSHIPHVEVTKGTYTYTVYFPKETHQICCPNSQSYTVLDLAELSSRVICKCLSSDYPEGYIDLDIPQPWDASISNPIGHCLMCSGPIVRSGYPVVYLVREASTEKRDILLSSLCCSAHCSNTTLTPDNFPHIHLEDSLLMKLYVDCKISL